LAFSQQFFVVDIFSQCHVKHLSLFHAHFLSQPPSSSRLNARLLTNSIFDRFSHALVDDAQGVIQNVPNVLYLLHQISISQREANASPVFNSMWWSHTPALSQPAPAPGFLISLFKPLLSFPVEPSFFLHNLRIFHLLRRIIILFEIIFPFAKKKQKTSSCCEDPAHTPASQLFPNSS
jgi:hypothetical protein